MFSQFGNRCFAWIGRPIARMSLRQYEVGALACRAAGAAVAVTLVSQAALAQCDHWAPLHERGVDSGNEVRVLKTWDPDGDGPLPSRLIAAGTFSHIGSVAANNIAMFDGNVWQPLGAGVNNTVRSVTIWDPDGNGPAIPQIVALGTFTRAGDVDASRIAAWDGTTWRAIGPGLASGSLVVAWDPDGPAGAAPLLFVAGVFPARRSAAPSLCRMGRSVELASE